ncbi:MAG: CRISPR-associated endonuclease Cas2 [Syntrophorhabdaceae bacterium]
MPYVIATYDIGEDRVDKVRKILKKYLSWVQNSVCEGDITEGRLKQCEYELSDVIDGEQDSIYIFKIENRRNIQKKTLGIDKATTTNFL